MLTFVINDVEYYIDRNPYTNGPMIARKDGYPIDNRKEICRQFLRKHGWTNEMFGKKITNDLERQIAKILREGKTPDEYFPQKEISTKPDYSIDEDGRRVFRVKSFEAKEEKSEPINTNMKVDISICVDKFLSNYNLDPNSRYKSYDHIRRVFIKYRKDENKRNLITLHLYSYLASWGMLRNSFLMQKDYLFSRPIVDILCQDKYDELLDFNPFVTTLGRSIGLILELVDEIRGYYVGKTYYLEGNKKPQRIENVTDTLVSKIILGTFGCTVAYDRYVKAGLSSFNMSQSISRYSINEICRFAKSNEEQIKEQLDKLNEFYTPMKIIDMYFFEKGLEIDRQ